MLLSRKTGVAGRLRKSPKSAIVVSNTNEENFRKLMTYHVDREPELLLLSAPKHEKVSIQGNLLTSEQALTDVAKFVKGTTEQIPFDDILRTVNSIVLL